MLAANTCCFSKNTVTKMANALEAQAVLLQQEVAISFVDTAGLFAYYRSMNGNNTSLVQQAGKNAAKISGRSLSGYLYGNRDINYEKATFAKVVESAHGETIGGFALCGASTNDLPLYVQVAKDVLGTVCCRR